MTKRGEVRFFSNENETLGSARVSGGGESGHLKIAREAIVVVCTELQLFEMERKGGGTRK